ncbi:hypothetical protein NHJ6243_005921 [Beauveria neobassiana]
MALQQPRQFPTTGFEVVDPAQKIEEERLPLYVRDEYYPMRIGEVVHEHYQVVAKLGYGTSSTVWLARDLRNGKYWVLKVYINTLQHNQELLVYNYLAKAPSNNPNQLGFAHVRQSHEAFQIDGPAGKHDVLVMTPLVMSLKTFQNMQKERVFPRELIAGALEQVFLGMNILHESDVIHTDLHADNLLIALADDSILASVEQNEIDTPCARKQRRKFYPCFSAWDLLEKEKLFDVYDSESQEHNDACHLAAMTALLGPPPPAFLEKSPVTRKYWDDDGNWTGLVPLPTERTFESLATALKGDDRDTFINFVECFLCPKSHLITALDRHTTLLAFCPLLAKGWWSLLRRAVYAADAGRIARVAAVAAAAAGSRKAVIRYFLDRMFKYELTTTG